MNYVCVPGKKKKDKGQKFMCCLNQSILKRKAIAFSGSHIRTYISNVLLLISLWLNLHLWKQPFIVSRKPGKLFYWFLAEHIAFSNKLRVDLLTRIVNGIGFPYEASPSAEIL